MNHRFTLDLAEALAARLASETNHADPATQIQRAFELALNRRPEDAELAAARALVAEHGMRCFCRALLNANELIYVH
jgi:hypothetical protein